MPFWEGLKKAPDLHLNHIIDLKVYDMYFVFPKMPSPKPGMLNIFTGNH